jgi:hypothetical protein
MKPKVVDENGKALPEEGIYPLKYLYDIFGMLFSGLSFVIF